jgi:two-component system chemotaxis sensor kinase CheA
VDQVQSVIVAELQDRLEEVFVALEQLRESGGDGKKTRRIVEAIFRNIHSFKASATANDFNRTAQVAHEFENLLHSLRSGKCRTDEEVLQVMSETADVLSASLLSRTANFSDRDKELVERLSAVAERGSTRERLEVEFVLDSMPPNILQLLNTTERHRLREAIGEGAIPYLIETAFDAHDFDRQFQQLQTLINTNGEVISTSPQVDAEQLGRINFRILYTRDADFEYVKHELSSLPQVTITELIPTKPDVTQPVAATQDESNSSERSIDSASDTIRINLDDLDRLISLTHALVRSTDATLDQAIRNNSEFSSQLMEVADGVSNSLLQLAARLVNLRMVSIDRILQRALRAGRSAAWSMGKDINFIVRGSELVIDKSLADSIADPLIHLVRNAVAHGIEDNERRRISGKPVPATVSIEACTIQGQTRIAVIDDGQGIDPKRIAEAARRLGLKTDPPPSMAQSVRLLFRPGFSTAEEVSGLSGRGVGLDAVESAIEETGGAITVASEPGQWSRFEIRLPVTFGLLDTAVVMTGGHRYLIDRTYISSLQQIDWNKTEQAGAELQMPVEDEIIRIVSLNTLMGGTSQPAKNERAFVLVCDFSKMAGDRSTPDRVGLLVDGIHANQRVLVRNLGSHGGRWFGVAGAAEMRDGHVALLLDLPRLITR